MSVALKLDTSAVKQTLSSEAATPIMNTFVNLMHNKPADAKVDDHKYDTLHPAFEALCKAFVQAKGEENYVEAFTQTMRKAAKQMGQQHAVSSYLRDKDVVPVITTTEEIADVNCGFQADEDGYGLKSLLIAIQVGGNARFIKLGDKTHFSSMKTIKEDLANKVHFLINFQAPASKPAEKTSRLAFLTIPFTWIMNIIKFPFATKTRASLTVVVVAALAAWYLGQTPSTETLSSWGETAQSWGGIAKARTWDQLPTWNATTTFLGNLKTKYIG